MAMTKEQRKTTNVVYDLQGTLLEACWCGILCPCWVGEDPDGGRATRSMPTTSTPGPSAASTSPG